MQREQISIVLVKFTKDLSFAAPQSNFLRLRQAWRTVSKIAVGHRVIFLVKELAGKGLPLFIYQVTCMAHSCVDAVWDPATARSRRTLAKMTSEVPTIHELTGGD